MRAIPLIALFSLFFSISIVESKHSKNNARTHDTAGKSKPHTSGHVVKHPPAVLKPVSVVKPATVVKTSDNGRKKEIAKVIGKALVKIGKAAYKAYKENKNRQQTTTTRRKPVDLVFNFNNRRTTASTTTISTTTVTTTSTTSTSTTVMPSATSTTVEPTMGNFTTEEFRNMTIDDIPMNSNFSDPLEVFIPLNSNGTSDEIEIPLND